MSHSLYLSLTNLNQILFISQTRLVLFCIAALLSGFSLCACTNAKRIDPALEIAEAPNPESLAAFDGNTRTPIGWEEVLKQVANANAVFVGETHDDASAHRVEHALVNAFLAAHPKAAVSLEMLERNEQDAVNLYLSNSSTLDVFLATTKSRDWAGENTWIPWYQPMLDSARNSGAQVIASNAPRKYVSIALREGYEPLRALPADERLLFEVDENLTHDGDWLRLRELMVEMHKERAEKERAEKGETGPLEPSDQDVDCAHRSQRVWDRTMGMSAAKTFAQKNAVIHIAGGFHLEQRLGTVAQFSRVCPDAKILVISLKPSASTEIAEKEIKGADIVIHTKSQLPKAQKNFD
jgi:uncharacterized iron-regulated protein